MSGPSTAARDYPKIIRQLGILALLAHQPESVESGAREVMWRFVARLEELSAIPSVLIQEAGRRMAHEEFLDGSATTPGYGERFAPNLTFVAEGLNQLDATEGRALWHWLCEQQPLLSAAWEEGRGPISGAASASTVVGTAGEPAVEAPPPPPPAPEQYVTLDQAAALVNRRKKTLERYLRHPKSKAAQMPEPDVEGTGGKPHEWRWGTLRPWLEKTFGKKLPEQLPSRSSRPPG